MAAQGATNGNGLSARHPDSRPMLAEVDAPAMPILFLMRRIAQVREIRTSLLVSDDEERAQELAMNAARCKTCRQA